MGSPTGMKPLEEFGILDDMGGSTQRERERKWSIIKMMFKFTVDDTNQLRLPLRLEGGAFI